MRVLNYTALTIIGAGLMLTSCSSEAPKEQVSVQPNVQQPNVQQNVAANERPNFMLIVVDDLGYSDLGIYGGEIDTPNIDALAGEGLMMTNFYVGGTCSPTRAMLMSGVDHHLAGIGAMGEHLAPNQKGQRGYEGYLNHDVVSLATRLQAADYRTYMAGKWHLGMTEELSPQARGFDESYALLVGGASHLDERGLIAVGDPASYRDNDALVGIPDGFTYSSDFYAQQMIDYIDEGKDTGQPFFGYLAFTAPHWPLHAMPEDMAKYKGRYDAGWDAIQNERFAKMKASGLVPANAKLPERVTDWPEWDKLSAEERAYEAKRMEIFAAMIDRTDRKIGEVVDYLKQTDQYDNTVFIFMSDNGSEGAAMQDMELFSSYMEGFDNSYESIGTKGSYIFLEERWAQVSGTPLRLWKGIVSDGGIKVPAFVTYGGAQNQGARYDGVVSVLDVMPTLLDFAGADETTGVSNPSAIYQPQGKSIVPLLAGVSDHVRSENDGIGWELFTRKGYRRGNWKALQLSASDSFSQGEWGLYDVSQDPGETTDLSAQNPEIMAEMIAEWEDYAESSNVIIGNEAPDR